MSKIDNPLSQIKHIVVLMMENRSFDNVLGWLYTKKNPPQRNQQFEGIEIGKIPVQPNPGPNGKTYLPSQGTIMTNPSPDPGEVYADVYNQQFNTQLPPDDIPNTSAVPPMNGFVNDYANHKPSEPEIIMQGFSPDSLPVMNGLASGFCVCDHWYSSIPSQTFCNRSFVHAGTSSGYVNNTWKTGKWPWDVDFFENKTTTIYNLLEKASISWRIYYGGPSLMCNAFLTQSQIQQYFDPSNPSNPQNRFFDMKQFLADAATPNGSKGLNQLPSYSFIEPNFLDHIKYGPENDYHPPYNPIVYDGQSNTLRGEALVFEVYNALFGDNAPNKDSTLLIVTFDEHGGTFDHVPPPLTVSPDGIVIPVSQPGGSGFDFKRLGVRVPTLLISPLIPENTICNTVFDHTSIIKTVINCFNLNKSLLAREAAAKDVSEVLTGPLRTTLPKITPRPVPPWNPHKSAENQLSDFQKAMLCRAAKWLKKTDKDLEKIINFNTVKEAVEFIDAEINASKL